MRVIKFRGKNIETGEWVYGWLVIHPDGTAYISQYYKRGEWVQVLPETVGHFVELKDLNGKEIFEDDILEGEAGKRYRIRWGISMNGYFAQTKDVHSNAYSSYHIIPKMKWVGTFHENPELWIV